MKKIFQFIFFLSIGVILLYYAFRDIRLDKLIDAIMTANYFWIFLALLSALIAIISRAIRWNLLINSLNYKPKHTSSTYALVLGYVANMAIPRIGEITRCGVLSKAENIPVDKLIGTVILERVIDLITLIILIFVVFFAKISLFGNFLTQQILNPIYSKISNNLIYLYFLIGIGLLTLIAFLILKNKLKKSKLYHKISKLLHGLFDGIKSITKMKNLSGFLFHTLLIWIMYFFMAYLMFFAIEATSNLDPIDGLFIMVIGGIGMSAPVQGGFGAFHWIVSLGLMLFGITMEDGLIYATISHEIQALFMLLLGGISFLMLFFTKKSRKFETT